MWFSTIWVKVVALIGILLMNMCRANMTLDEVETTLQFEVATNALPIKINPDGPLNFLRGLIYQKMECMYNKRFFASQIDTNYFVEEKSDKTNNYHWYTYIRDRQIDKAYKALTANKMDVYAEKYHSHLIDLFPSPNGDITIETRGNQSFIQFLRAETTEKHALQILAMLLLFSEGVSIPIKVNNTVLKVYEIEKKDEIYFEVPMEIPWLNLVEDKVQTFQQKKVKQLISFFQENAANKEVLRMMEDKCSYDEVAAGKFLDSPKFLIQSYIFGFIDSAECAAEFIQTVHIMTEKYASKTEAPSKDVSVYDKLFKPTGTATRTDSMALMKSTQDILNTNRTFPFADVTQLPSYTSVPMRDPITKVFSTGYLEKYSNCVECMILSLFCCLAYDPSDFTYKTDHMGNVSKELKEFFLPKKNEIFDTTKDELQIKWCRVVACLDEPRIAYCKKRNELDCGIINMLMVIAEIVNVSKEEKNKIFRFAQSLKEQKEKLHYKLSNDIEEYTKALLKRLSKTENVEISFSDIKSKNYSNGRYDISGKITMIFEHSNIKNTIVLEISNGHSNIEMVPTIANSKFAQIKKLNEMVASCKNGATFIESLLAIYMDYEIRKIDTYKNNKTFMKTQVRKTIENNCADINRLLLIKKINALGYKTDLVGCLIIYSMDQKLSPVHPIIRFTSNIIGSSELDNLSVRIRMIPPAILTSRHTKSSNNINYPKIRLFEENYKNSMVHIKNDYFTECVLECDMSIFIIWAKYCIDNFCPSNKEEIHKLFGGTITRSIYGYIFRDQNMKLANELNEAITKGYPDTKDIMLNSLHNIWFIHLIVEENLNVELIKTNFHAIRTPIHTPSIFTYIRRRNIVQNFIKMENHLCIDKDTIVKFNELFHIYNSKPKSL
ncbi:hypothetical protein NEAUS06_2094 [Nematocida ausubeli]|nr:hypothetical protein NEAUS06_2094 [Nematocida ausubeli]